MKIGQQPLSFLCVLLFSSAVGILAAEQVLESVSPLLFAGLLLFCARNCAGASGVADSRK